MKECCFDKGGVGGEGGGFYLKLNLLIFNRKSCTEIAIFLLIKLKSGLSGLKPKSSTIVLSLRLSFGEEEFVVPLS